MKAKEVFVPKIKGTQNSLNLDGDLDCTKNQEVFAAKLKSQLQMIDCNFKETGEVQAAGDQAMMNPELLDWMQDTEGDIDCIQASEASEGFETKLESQIVDNSSEDNEKRNKRKKFN